MIKLYSPAYGTVQSIRKIGDYRRVSIFLAVYDNHDQFASIGGTVTRTKYQKGTFHIANLVKKSRNNERMEITIKSEHGFTIKIFQIAGLVARTIKTYVKKGSRVRTNQKIGRIEFGSRVDLYFPARFEVKVKDRDKVYGTKTIIAQWAKK